jgi:transcriptional regulator with XRE-family HTH domain
MTGMRLRTTRQALGLTQQQAARRWGVSQAYLSLMERGRRRVPVRLARRLAGTEPQLAASLPPRVSTKPPDDLPKLLGTLGYPGFAYLADRRAVVNPAEVVLSAVSATDTPARVTEALPWVLMMFQDLPWDWLVAQAKLANAQNRLGYLVAVARQAADRAGHTELTGRLASVEAELEEARLAREDTLAQRLTDAEKRHLRTHRPEAAAHWNLLTRLRAEDLRHAV